MILDVFQERGKWIQAMRLIGGGARNAPWRQILADVYGLPVLLPRLLTEATSLGAAIAGGVGVGLYPDYRVAQEFVRVEEAEKPAPERQEQYTALYALFKKTYDTLEPIFDELSRFS